MSLSELKKLITESAYRIFEANEEEELNSLPQDNTEEPTEPVSDISNDSNDTDTINEPINTPVASTSSQAHEFDHLGTVIAKLANKIGKNEKELDNIHAQILKAVSTGRVNKDFNFSKYNYGSGKKDNYDYFVSVLAALYKDADATDKKNIRNVIFITMPVYEQYNSMEGSDKISIRPSALTKLVARKAGIGYDLRGEKTIDASYYVDIVAESIYKAIDYALEKYRPDDGIFSSVAIFKAVGLTQDALESKLHQKTFAAGGQKFSLDEPLGKDGEEDETKMDRITGDETGEAPKDKEAVRSFVDAIKNFVNEKLGSKPKLSKYLEFFNLFSLGHNMSEIADMMDIKYDYVRVIKKRMEDFLTKFVESGDMQDYLYEETGMKVNFPNNKFALSATGGPGEKGAKVEPIEIFKITGNNPNTGEPEGEWVEITPSTADSDTTWFDKYGDLVFDDKKEEPEPVSVGNDIEDTAEEDDEAEQMRQHIAEAINNYLRKRLQNG